MSGLGLAVPAGVTSRRKSRQYRINRGPRGPLFVCNHTIICLSVMPSGPSSSWIHFRRHNRGYATSSGFAFFANPAMPPPTTNNEAAAPPARIC